MVKKSNDDTNALMINSTEITQIRNKSKSRIIYGSSIWQGGPYINCLNEIGCSMWPLEALNYPNDWAMIKS